MSTAIEGTDKPYLKLPEMTWPNPIYGRDLNWRLRYAPESITREDQLHLASVLGAYDALIEMTGKRRNKIVSMMRKVIDRNYSGERHG